jgi:hypothetical protein
MKFKKNTIKKRSKTKKKITQKKNRTKFDIKTIWYQMLKDKIENTIQLKK